MKPIEDLSVQENEELLKFTAYISLLAADSDNKPDEAGKKSAIKFSYIKTYSCDPLLSEFYEETDKVIENNIQYLNKDLPIKKAQRDATIRKELLILEKIVLKLVKDYTSAMYRIMKSFKEHILKAHHSVFADFIFPMPIERITV